MATASYLNPDLTFNRAAIMRAAHVEARADVARAAACGRKRLYGAAFKAALLFAWSDAHSARYCADRDARLTALPAAHAAILSERTAALMIDSTSRMVAEVAAIDVRALALGVRL